MTTTDIFKGVIYDQVIGDALGPGTCFIFYYNTQRKSVSDLF